MRLVEEAWCDLLEWLNSSLDQTPLWTPKVLSRDGYGWVEFVAPVDCTEKAAFERFYYRAGMLLCLVYVLQGFDFHRKNILASGEHPVLIDLETILAPEVQLGARVEQLIEGHHQTFRSVLTTGLLPNWEEVENGGSFDISGLGSLRVATEQRTLSRMPRVWRRTWARVGTACQNLPRC